MKLNSEINMMHIGDDVVASVTYKTQETDDAAKEVVSLLKSKNITYHQAVEILEQARSMLDLVTI